MKWIIHKLSDIFKPEQIQQIKTEEIIFALEDATVRKVWLQNVFDRITNLNRDVDFRLRGNAHYDVADLAFKRQAIQEVLEDILAAKRQVQGNNPRTRGEFDLESVTVQAV